VDYEDEDELKPEVSCGANGSNTGIGHWLGLESCEGAFRDRRIPMVLPNLNISRNPWLLTLRYGENINGNHRNV
jgi:hypothetical protein